MTLTKTNQKGFGHHILLPLLAFVAVGVIGVVLLSRMNALTSSSSYAVWHWNIAGYKMNKGSTTNGLTATAKSSIVARNAQLVSFNEMCESQYLNMKSRLKDAQWPKSSAFSAFVTSKKDACKGKPYGNAIFIKAGVSDVKRYTLPSDGRPEHRTMVCALVKGTKDRFCTVHITPSNDLVSGQAANVRQLNAARTILEDFYKQGERVIIAGDFNAQPDYSRLNNWYAASLKTAVNSNNTGQYREVDDKDTRHCNGYGEITAMSSTEKTPCGSKNKKIDLIFVRENQVSDYTGDSLSIAKKCGASKNQACSDHRILLGYVTFKQ